MAAMRLQQVQRFILAKKIFWGLEHLKKTFPTTINCVKSDWDCYLTQICRFGAESWQ